VLEFGGYVELGAAHFNQLGDGVWWETRPNRRRKQVNAGPFDELNRLVWVAELSLIFHDLDLILDARDCAQLRLDRDVADLVAIVCHFFGLLDSGTFPQSAMLSAEAAKYLIRSE